MHDPTKINALGTAAAEHCYTPSWCRCPDEPKCQLCKSGRCPVEPPHTAALLRCRCLMSCTERATQEDMRCDTCRRGPDLHMHVGDPGDPLGQPMRPIATSGPVVFK